MKTRIMVLLGLSLLLATTYVHGQSPALKAPIDFPFTVEGKVFPAGQYEFSRTDDGMAFRVQGEGSNGILAIIMTRLYRKMHEKNPESYLVFDKVGDTYMLSEIWLPDEDGYLMATTKTKHTHKTVHMK